MEGIISAWGRILTGYTPAMSIEITRECPLRCPGCYAYGDDHLGGEITLREVRDFKGQELVDGVLGLVDKHRPLHLSIVGGEPLVRYRELERCCRILAGSRHSRAARHERRPRNSQGVARPPPLHDRRLDRRPAAGARRPPHAGDLRAHPEAHRRAPDHGALHGHPAADQPARLSRRLPAVLVRQAGSRARSG